MNLISVSNGRRTAVDGVVDYTVVADLADGAGPQTMEYSYHPEDPYGLAPQIGEYLAANPVEVAPYTAPEPSPPDPPSMQDRLSALESLLVAKAVVQQSDIDQAVVNIAVTPKLGQVSL